MKRILIITHEASRTGAPLVMLYLVRWLRQNRPDLVVDVLALKGGAIEEDFRAAASDLVIWKAPAPPAYGILLRAIRKGLRIVGLQHVPTNDEVKEAMLAELAGRGYDVVLSNSLASIPVGVRIKQLAGSRPLLISFIQELQMVIRQLLPDLPKYIPFVDRFWAVSELGRQNLIRNWGVPADQIEVQYVTAMVNSHVEKASSARSDGTFRVGGVGSVVMRKGYDLFIQVASWVNRNHPEFNWKFIWAGGIYPYDRPLIEHDVQHAGLEGVVEFVGELEDPSAIYRELDVFLLPSREEPFGLVCIEAGTMGNPIICFEGVTGAAEIMQNGGGKVVPYLNVEAMSRAVVAYAQDAELRQRDGQLNRVQFAQLGTDQQCPLMLQRIEAALARKTSGA